MWLARLTWAIAIFLSGVEEPLAGPFPGNERALAFLSSDLIFLNLLVFCMAALRFYVIAKFVDIISSSHPDATLARNQIDDLNRFCTYYNLPNILRRKLREYAHERKEVSRVSDCAPRHDAPM